MSLNIKNARTVALAVQLAKRLDTTLTQAVTIALEEKLDATEQAGDARAARALRILEIGAVCAERLSPTVKALDPGELLYDDLGLPK